MIGKLLVQDKEKRDDDHRDPRKNRAVRAPQMARRGEHKSHPQHKAPERRRNRLARPERQRSAGDSDEQYPSSNHVRAEAETLLLLGVAVSTSCRHLALFSKLESSAAEFGR